MMYFVFANEWFELNCIFCTDGVSCV